MSVWYGCYERWSYWEENGAFVVRDALKLGFLGIQNMDVAAPWADIFLYVDAAIKFFFFSLVLVYLAAHMKPKEFLS